MRLSGSLPLLLALATIASRNDNGVSSFSMGGWSKQGGSSILKSGSFTVVKQSSLNSNNKVMKGAARTSSSRSSTQLSMAIDRMSEDCVGAIMISHNLGNGLGLDVLRNDIMMAGIIGRPERAAKTLAKYRLEYQMVKASAIQYVKKSGVPMNEDGNSDLSPLPFSDEAKKTLTEATKIADYFDSKAIRSEFVLLALLGYNYGEDIEPSRVTSGMEVILGTTGLVGFEKFDAYDFCEELVDDIKNQPINEANELETGGARTIVEEETIVIGAPAPGSTATLDDVGVDLTQMALDGKLDVVYGRDNEIRMAMRTLGRRRKNNPCLIGDPGVGKTAIAEAIAQVLASSYDTTTTTSSSSSSEDDKKSRFSKLNPFRKENDDKSPNGGGDLDLEDIDSYGALPPCPAALAGYRLISVELASLVAGTRNRGDFEEKVQNLIREASNSNIILFIDEIHNLIGTGGGGDGAMNAANLMKPALARGDIRVLGATTTPEYRRYIEKDGALERRFQPLDVKEPTVDETMDILGAVMPRYEEYHNVEYTSNALLAAAKLSDRYVSDRFLPDKAIDLLDEAGSMVKMSLDENYFVTEDAIELVVSEISGIPVGRLDTGEKARLRNLEIEMGKRIKGQERAVKAVAKSIRRARSGMRDGKRPVANFLFCGPTGVGKTELCKALAETYFGREKDMIRIDMSEYMDRFSTSRLVGAPPGYVGYDEGGQLTEAVRRAPHSVVLFDELEKAHEDVLNVLLQIMDEGQLTDGKGRKVNFKNTVFVMTSNIGSQKILEASKTATGDNLDQSLDVAEIVKDELESTMKPELLNRIDEIVVFSPLSYDNLRDIASNILSDCAQRAADDQNMSLTVSDELVKMVTREGFQFSGQFGARPIRRAAQRYLEDTMAEAIMREFVNEGDEVYAEIASEQEKGSAVDKDRVVVKITKTDDSGQSSSILIPVEDEAGIGSVEGSLEWQALNGPVPSLDDPPSPEPGNSWA